MKKRNNFLIVADENSGLPTPDSFSTQTREKTASSQQGSAKVVILREAAVCSKKSPRAKCHPSNFQQQSSQSQSTLHQPLFKRPSNAAFTATKAIQQIPAASIALPKQPPLSQQSILRPSSPTAAPQSQQRPQTEEDESENILDDSAAIDEPEIDLSSSKCSLLNCLVRSRPWWLRVRSLIADDSLSVARVGLRLAAAAGVLHAGRRQRGTWKQATEPT